MNTDLSSLRSLRELKDSDKMPVLFIGHGSPMNAIEDNNFHKSWVELGKLLPKPKAILSISAHWLTYGSTKVTAMEKPRTIHDFGGFPEELYHQQYPAPGSPSLASETVDLVSKPAIQLDSDWGLDHGTWSVIKPMFPNADIPVYQLSINFNEPMQYHYDLGLQLKQLREKGVLIIGSGNIVHNLGAMNYSNHVYDWAQEFDNQIKQFIDDSNHEGIINFHKLGSLGKMAHPSHDHFIPLVYTIALQGENEKVNYFNDSFDLGSISMRSMVIG